MFVCPQRTARRYQGVFPDSVEAPEADFASLALARMAAAADFFKKSRRVSPEKGKSAFTNLEGDWTERGRGRAAGRLFLAGKIFCRRRIAAFSKQPAKSDAPREPSCSAQKSFRRVFGGVRVGVLRRERERSALFVDRASEFAAALVDDPQPDLPKVEKAGEGILPEVAHGGMGKGRLRIELGQRLIQGAQSPFEQTDRHGEVAEIQGVDGLNGLFLAAMQGDEKGKRERGRDPLRVAREELPRAPNAEIDGLGGDVHGVLVKRINIVLGELHRVVRLRRRFLGFLLAAVVGRFPAHLLGNQVYPILSFPK